MRQAALALALVGADAAAQPQEGAGRWQPEVRADFLRARESAAHLGVGVAVPAGTYVRVALVAGAGGSWRRDTTILAGRVDALARFVVDPLREFRWAPYAAGGLSALFDEREDWRAVLTAAVGVEGPDLGGMVPAFEVGFGGGTRIGVVARRALRGRR